MAKIEIHAPPVELGAFGEQWNAVVADLEHAGHHVVIKAVEEVRTAGVWLPLPESLYAETIPVILDFDDEGVDESVEVALLAVIEATRRNLRGRLNGVRLRTVQISDTSGSEPLAIVSIRRDRGRTSPD